MYKFVHHANTVKAYRLTRDMIIKTERGRQNARAGMWHIIGVNGKEYVIDNDTFLSSYRPQDAEAQDYFQQAQEEF